MLVELPNKSTFFSPMQTDPLNIREKLFQGIDRCCKGIKPFLEGMALNIVDFVPLPNFLPVAITLWKWKIFFFGPLGCFEVPLTQEYDEM